MPFQNLFDEAMNTGIASRQRAKEILQQRIFQENQNAAQRGLEQQRIDIASRQANQSDQYRQDELARLKQNDLESTRRYNENKDLQLFGMAGQGMVRPAQTEPSFGSGLAPTLPSPDAGKPSFSNSQGQSFVPTTPQERADIARQTAVADLKAKKDADNAEFNSQLDELVKNNPDFAKDNAEDIAAMKFHHVVGWAPPDQSIDKVQGGLLKEYMRPTTTPERKQVIMDTIGQVEKMKHPGQAAPQIDPIALDRLATTYHETGQIPSNLGFGNRSGMVKELIVNREATMFPEGVSMAGNAAAYKANRESLTKLMAGYDAISSYDRMFRANLERFINAAQKVADTGHPFLNEPLRDIQNKILGDPNMPVFQAARDVNTTEFSRLANNPNLTGILAESAKKETANYNPRDATLAQALNVSKLMLQEAQQRPAEMAEQISRISTRMHLGVDELKRLKEETAKEHVVMNDQGKIVPAPITAPTVQNSPGPGVPPPPVVPRPTQAGQVLDRATAQKFYELAGKDPKRAQSLAEGAGWVVSK